MQRNEPENQGKREQRTVEGAAEQAAPEAEEDTAGFLSLGLPAYPLPAPQPAPLPRPIGDIIPLGPPGGRQLAP